MSKPVISVIMSVYNTKEDFLREAIDSILNQTYRNFEFIIINDASTDNSLNILNSYKDDRIVLINNERNLGLTKSLNIGLRQANGKYIARMDADDIALPNRFEKQLNFMEEHSEIDILGGMALILGNEQNAPFGYMPINNEITRIRMLFFNAAFPHSSAFIRTSFLKENNLKYDEEILKSQDYDLWVRCLNFGKLYALPEILILYRIHENQITNRTGEEQNYYKELIRIRQLHKLTESFSKNENEAFLRLTDITRDNSVKNIYSMGNKLIASNLKSEIYNHVLFKREVVLWSAYNSFYEIRRSHSLDLVKIITILRIMYPNNLFHFIKYFYIPRVKASLKKKKFRRAKEK